jgi:uncharacterized protein (TIGR02300 family)
MMNVRPQLGVKRRCLTCTAAFFDLNRTPIACPKCGAAFKVVEIAHSRPVGAPVVYRKRPVEAALTEVEAAPVDDDAGEESTIPLRDNEDENEELGAVIDIPVDDQTERS